MSESIDGLPLSKKIMTCPPICPKDWGDIKNMKKEFWDTGSLRFHTFPNFWIHSTSDYSVSFHFTPVDALVTKITSYWIVHENAIENIDYDLNKLIHYWKMTAEQDWELCENNQRGIRSSKYLPGPLMLNKESGVDYFIEWYLKNLEK